MSEEGASSGLARAGGSRTARPLLLALLSFALIAPAAALAAYPGTDPDESVRANTPDDPEFDRCEPDDEQGQSCTDAFGQQSERFGFAPAGTESTALYNPAAAPTRQPDQNDAAGRTTLGQVSGVSQDRAHKYFGEDDPGGLVGDPDVEVAILDTGIRWDRGDLRKQVSLNPGELPEPQDAGGTPCGEDDCNGDGAFDVDDFADDPRVGPADGNDEADGLLDASDLLAAFSDGADDDGNGFVDDIAGWDFFDDDNDPYDASSYSTASNHGSGRAEEAVAQGNNADDGIGVCPDCQFVPIRVWDTFVADSNNFALGVLYAADNGIEIVEGAVGGLSNTRFAREAFAYAYEQGTLPVMVSSDLNTANHNYPTNYDHTLQVQGTVADLHGLGEDFCPQECIDFFNDAGLPLVTNAPVGTWFRNSGTTQYGGHAHIVMVGPTGSQDTGQAAGAAALIKAFGNRQGLDLSPNEIKQLITLTAEDVHPLNTLGTGTPDPALIDSWDQHFGYGRADLGAALEAIRDGEVPPEALLTAPDWFAPLNLADRDEVEVEGFAAADEAPLAGGKRFDWELRWAPGIEPCPADFDGASQLVASGSGDGPLEAPLGTLDLAAVRAALDARTDNGTCGNPGPVSGGSTVDPTAPAKGPGDVDPNEPAFTVKLEVTDTDGNVGEDRKVLFAYRDEGLLPGWSRPIGGTKDHSGEADGGGESSHRLFDLDGDNDLEVIEATSSGELWVLDHDGTPNPSFNGGAPVRTRDYPNVHAGSPGLSAVEPPDESLRIPAIGDIDGDRAPEIVDTAGEHVYAWNADGSVVGGFPVRVDPALSLVADRSRANHIKRGFIASPTLGDLDGDGDLEIVAPALDAHVYALDGDGSELPGFPVRLRDRDGGEPIPCSSDFECGEIINTAAVGDITGDGEPEIVVPTNEFDHNPAAPEPPAGLGGFGGLLNNVLAEELGGSNRLYAIGTDGSYLPGWPVAVSGIIPDALPLVGPGVDHALGDVDGDAVAEVVGNVATGDVQARDGGGSTAVDYESIPEGGELVDQSKVLNLFENPVVAEFDGNGGLEVLKGGITLNGLINVGVAVGQNLPYNHALQAWNGASGLILPAFPQAVEDYQLLSSPAVGDLSDAPGAEAIVGTGLYLIRNINAAGVEGSGWPKFTGGWNFAVPALGDVDGDGTLEVAAQTREGFAFLWETGADACGGGNDEWWTSRHDEWSTGAHGTDTRPPGTPEDLAAEIRRGGINVSFEAPGDDWLCGEAQAFEVRVGQGPISSPSDGRKVQRGRAKRAAGDRETVRIGTSELGDATHIGVLARDEAGNWGAVASLALPEVCERTIDGGAGPDRLRGTFFSERMRGRAGDDEIRAGNGRDCLRGGSGDDDVRAQGGPDTVRGNAGDDVLRGGRSGDEIRGNRGEDQILGRRGPDFLRGGADPDTVRGGGGADVINVRGGGVDTVRCGKGNDLVRAGRRDIVRPNCETVRIGRG